MNNNKKNQTSQPFGLLHFSSVAQSCPPLCDPMDCSTPGLPVHHQLPEFTQTHVHRNSDAIQPSHLLLSPVPPASGSFLGSQFFVSGGQSFRASASATVLPMNIQDWFPLGLTGWISLQSKGLSGVFSGPISSWQIEGETMETVSDFIFLGPKITADGDCSREIKSRSLGKKLWPT